MHLVKQNDKKRKKSKNYRDTRAKLRCEKYKNYDDKRAEKCYSKNQADQGAFSQRTGRPTCTDDDEYSPRSRRERCRTATCDLDHSYLTKGNNITEHEYSKK